MVGQTYNVNYRADAIVPWSKKFNEKKERDIIRKLKNRLIFLLKYIYIYVSSSVLWPDQRVVNQISYIADSHKYEESSLKMVVYLK